MTANMIDVLPAIDIRGGRCVRLVQGDYERETVFDDDPIAQAQRWIDEGAEMLHVIDLDGAREGRAVNTEIIGHIVEAGARVQVGGGIRDLETATRYVSVGAERVIVGTAAYESTYTDQEFIKAAVAELGDALTVSVDASAGMVRLSGWTEHTGHSPWTFARDIEILGVRRFIYTDIDSDGTLGGHREEHFGQVLKALAHSPVIAAGGIADPMQIRHLAANGAAGVVLGRALYDGRLTLADAFEAAASGVHERTC